MSSIADGNAGLQTVLNRLTTNKLSFFSSEKMSTQLNVHLRRWCDGGETRKFTPFTQWNGKKHTRDYFSDQKTKSLYSQSSGAAVQMTGM